MEQSFWEQIWVENTIRFHQPKVNHWLARYFNELALPGNKALVPLCGKSHDMSFLLERGMDVTGVEFSELAVKAYFKENNLDYEVNELGAYKEYKGQRISLLQGDIFDLDSQLKGKFDFIFDRAALVALNPADQKRYVKQLLSILSPTGCFFLIVFDYDAGGKLIGPPFNISDSKVRELFADCRVRLIDEFEMETISPKYKENGVSHTISRTYLINHF